MKNSQTTTNDVIKVVFPSELSKEIIEGIFAPYLATLEKTIPSKSFFNLHNLMEYPSVEIKLSIFSYLKKIRTVVPGDKVAFLVRNKMDNLMITSILTVSGHLAISKIFYEEAAAFAWLSIP